MPDRNVSRTLNVTLAALWKVNAAERRLRVAGDEPVPSGADACVVEDGATDSSMGAAVDVRGEPRSAAGVTPLSHMRLPGEDGNKAPCLAGDWVRAGLGLLAPTKFSQTNADRY